MDPPLLAEGRDVALRPAGVPWLRFLFVGAACVLCFCTPGSMSMVETGGLGAAMLCLALLPWFWKPTLRVFLQPVMWLVALWGAWGLISMAWTPDPAKGWWELGTLRFTWFVVVLWPALRYRRHLILALVLGFLAANVAQGVLAVIRAGGWTHLDFGARYPDRNAGWWVHPAVCGYMLVPALGLHLPAAMFGRGRVAWLARAGMVVTWAGIFATGTRGAMLAGAALTAAGAAGALAGRWRASSPRGRRTILIAAGTAMLASAGVVAGLASSDTHSGRRLREGVREIAGVLRDDDVSTFTGARVQFVRWAWDQFAAQPLRGTGVGGYGATIRESLGQAESPTGSIPSQAHNTFAHVAATLGLPGVILATIFAAVVIRGGFAGLNGRWSTYDAGPGWAALGMLAITPFDVVYVNSPPTALLAVLTALCLRPRPRVAPVWPERAGY